jgi:hypothetical protein
VNDARSEEGALMKTPGPTALLIPCPWSGDENDPAGMSYRLWFWLYRTTRVLRHRFGAHDWRHEVTGSGMKRCTWCGARRRPSE